MQWCEPPDTRDTQPIAFKPFKSLAWAEVSIAMGRRLWAEASMGRGLRYSPNLVVFYSSVATITQLTELGKVTTSNNRLWFQSPVNQLREYSVGVPRNRIFATGISPRKYRTVPVYRQQYCIIAQENTLV